MSTPTDHCPRCIGGDWEDLRAELHHLIGHVADVVGKIGGNVSAASIHLHTLVDAEISNARAAARHLDDDLKAEIKSALHDVADVAANLARGMPHLGSSE